MFYCRKEKCWAGSVGRAFRYELIFRLNEGRVVKNKQFHQTSKNYWKNIFNSYKQRLYVERVFSLMGNLWCDERNRLSVEIVKSELCGKLNYNMNSQEFLQFFKNLEQEKLLKWATKILSMILNLNKNIFCYYFFS